VKIHEKLVVAQEHWAIIERVSWQEALLSHLQPEMLRQQRKIKAFGLRVIGIGGELSTKAEKSLHWLNIPFQGHRSNCFGDESARRD